MGPPEALEEATTSFEFAQRRVLHEETLEGGGALDAMSVFLLVVPPAWTGVAFACGWVRLGILSLMGACVCASLVSAVLCGRLLTVAAGVVYPNDGYRITSARFSAWLSRDDGTAACDREVMLRVEVTLGGCVWAHGALAPFEPAFLCYCERARVQCSFSAADLRAAVRKVLRPATAAPLIVRVDAMEGEGCEAVAASHAGELNYRRFKRAIAEDSVAKRLPLAEFPNRVSCRVRRWSRAAGAVAGTKAKRPVVIVRVRELTSCTAKGHAMNPLGGGDASFVDHFRLPCPDLSTNIAFHVDSGKNLKRRFYGQRAKDALGSWSMRARDLVDVVCSAATRGGGFVELGDDVKRRYGIVRGAVALLDDDEDFVGHGGGPVLAFDGAVRTDGEWCEGVPSGVLDLRVRLSRAPSAPALEAQLDVPSRRLTPLEQLSLQLSEETAFKRLRPPKRAAVLFQIRRVRVARVRLSVTDLFAAAPKAKPDRGFAVAREFRHSQSSSVETRDDDTVALTRARRFAALKDKEVFYAPVMDLSDATRDRDPNDHAQRASTLSLSPRTEAACVSHARGRPVPLSQREATKRIVGEGLRQLRDDGGFEWHVANTLFGSDGAARNILSRRFREIVHGDARYVALKLTAALRRFVFHTATRQRHVYAETAEDVARLAVPVERRSGKTGCFDCTSP